MTTFHTSRLIPSTPEEIFAAISHPERLARWWGPKGFTNTFSVCEFKVGGQWKFVMHGPDGKDYPNESVFEAIEPDKKVVIRHVVEPKFRLTISLSPSDTGTLVDWSQEFEDDEVAKKVESIVVPSNEENLDRLVEEVSGR